VFHLPSRSSINRALAVRTWDHIRWVRRSRVRILSIIHNWMKVSIFSGVRLDDCSRADSAGLCCLGRDSQTDFITSSRALTSVILNSRSLVHVGSHDHGLLLVILPDVVGLVLSTRFVRLSLL
jgi:hypothetical protein